MIVADENGNILVENEVAKALVLSDPGTQGGSKKIQKDSGLRTLLEDFPPEPEGKFRERLISLFDLKTGRHRHYRVRIGLLPSDGEEPIYVLFATAEPERVHFGEVDALVLSRIRHEIRTPLTTLRGFSELMLNRLYPESKRKQFLRIIIEETDRLVDFLDEIFSLDAVSHEPTKLGARGSSQATK